MDNLLPSFPHNRINVIDFSSFTPVTEEVLPLHLPQLCLKAQSGPIGKTLYYPTFAEAEKVLGAETFNEQSSSYFSTAALYAKQAFSRANGVWLTRVADQTASKKSFVIVELSVTPADVVQYQKDGDGNRILDGSGDPIPVDDNGSPLTESGYEISWSTRTVLANPETVLTAVSKKSEDIGGGVIKETFPIFVYEAHDEGLYGDDLAFRFYYDEAASSADRVARNGSVFFAFEPVRRQVGTNTVVPHYDDNGNVGVSFSMKPDTFDSSVAQYVSVSEVLETNYKNNKLPYEITIMSAYWQEAMQTLQAVEVNNAAELVDEWYVNPLTLRNEEGQKYDHVVFASGSKAMARQTVNYLGGGADGDLTDTVIEAEVVKYYTLALDNEIVNNVKYPMTHIYDAGYSLDTKYKLIDFMGIREDVIPVLSTQRTSDIGGAPVYNTKAEDLSIGAVLRARALLFPESTLKGTEAFRCIIFSQAGKILSQTYRKIVPASLWYIDALSKFHNVDHMKASPQGLPNAAVELFEEYNYVPNSDDQKQRSWDTGINYFQLYTRSDLHYASIRTIYRNESSVLSSAEFANAVVYTKQAVQPVWAKYAGTQMPAEDLHSAVEDDLTTRLTRIYNGKYELVVDAFQNELERNLGYVHHVNIDITSPAENRVWDVDIRCFREGFGQG